jgi:hypothetical protein
MLVPTKTVRLEVPEPPGMFELLNVTVGPDGETDTLNVTLPVKPLLGVMVMIVASGMNG